ncbi:MAG: metallophosphoesterase family protein [Gammaproteobacteria bacterium]|nr:metallophosphoesterase family protein [Gammaproteobacteria bacterium]
MDHQEIVRFLQKRLGRLHASQRLGIESDAEPQVFGKGLNFFHPENWYSTHALIRYCIKLSGLWSRGKRNTLKHQIHHHDIHLPNLPKTFEGYTLLHLSDLHVDMHWDATHALAKKLATLDYDICVMTGDFRAHTFGPFQAALEGMKLIADTLTKPTYAVLGNHDSINMVPELEAMGIQVLLNESVLLERDGDAIHLAGVDDAHYFRVDNIEKAANNVPPHEVSILLSHTPEIYKQAAHADFNVMLCGHTHGGQICLPGGIPITLDASCPRRMGSGRWQHHNMIGYTSRGAGTSIVSVRFNCPPEITLHHLHNGVSISQ